MSCSVSPFESGETEMPRNQHPWPAGHAPRLGTCSHFSSLTAPGARELLSLLMPWCIHSFRQEPIWAGCSSPQPQPHPHPQPAKSQSSESAHTVSLSSLFLAQESQSLSSSCSLIHPLSSVVFTSLKLCSLRTFTVSLLPKPEDTGASLSWCLVDV